jgi:hypothetical protein
MLVAGPGFSDPKILKRNVRRDQPRRRPVEEHLEPPKPPANSAVNEHFEELLAKGNEARDGRKFSEAEEAYQGAAKLKPSRFPRPLTV